MHKSSVFVPILALLIFSACQPTPDKNRPSISPLVYSTTALQTLVSEKIIVVVDENKQPLARAAVLIGYALNDPFPGNFFQTDEKGQLPVPAQWTSELPVTVDFPGMVRATYLNQKPEGLLFELHSKPLLPNAEIYGTTQGHEIKNYDGELDFGLALETMTKEELLSFDLQRVISPFKDKLSVIGFSFDVPGNISFPKQKETYVLPLTIEKPHYRIQTALGPRKIFGTQGRFPFKKIVDSLREDVPVYDLVPLISFQSGVIRDIVVQGAKTELNLPTNSQKFSVSYPVQAPNYNNTDDVCIVINSRHEQNFYYPTDLKRLQPLENGSLQSSSLSDNHVIAVLKHKTDFDPQKSSASRMSSILEAVTDASRLKFDFLPLLDDPRLLAEKEFFVQAPKAPSGLHPLSTMGILSRLVTVKNDQGSQQVIANRIWEIYSANWVEKIRLPEFPEKRQPRVRLGQRFEFIFVGSKYVDSVPMGQAVVENASHITRSSMDF